MLLLFFVGNNFGTRQWPGRAIAIKGTVKLILGQEAWIQA